MVWYLIRVAHWRAVMLSRFVRLILLLVCLSSPILGQTPGVIEVTDTSTSSGSKTSGPTTPGPSTSNDGGANQVPVDSLSRLSEFGLLGTLLAIALGAVMWLYGRQNTLWQDRLKDWQAQQERLDALKAQIGELASTSEQRTRAQEESARAAQLLAQANAQHISELSRMREELAALRQEISRVAAICSKWDGRQ